MEEKKDIKKIDNLNVISVKNITRIILTAPEISHEDIKQFFVHDDIQLIHVSGNLFLIEAKNIPIEKFAEVDKKICDLIDKIKILQVGFYDVPKNQSANLDYYRRPKRIYRYSHQRSSGSGRGR